MSSLVKCTTKKQVDTVIDFVAPFRERCLYVYLDLIRYGVSNPAVESWIDSLKNPSTVAMRYHNGLHVFALPGVELTGLRKLVATMRPALVLGESSVIAQISGIDSYVESANIGVVMKQQSANVVTRNECMRATMEDIDEVAKLILSEDSLASGYSKPELIEQMSERWTNGYGRSYIIRRDGAVVAHAGTGAESSGVATIVDVIVDAHHRRRGLAREVVSFLCNELVSEGLSPYLYCYEEGARRLYLSLGFKAVCEWSRLVRVDKY